jgi:hypothetical protein
MAVPSALTPSSDASYLRRLLERQPACLIRVRLDGVLLACNDAALRLLGVGAPRAVLNTNLTDRIVPAQRTRWQEFATRCWANGAASLECDLVIGDDDARPVLVQGVALKDRPNGVESLLLHFRDQSQTHRLEHSIQSAENDRVGNEERHRAARDQVEEATVERLKLAVLAEQGEAERRRLTEALEAQTADRQRRLTICVELEKKVEESQLVLLEREREHRDGVAALKTALAAAHAAQITAVAGHDNQELEAVKLRLQTATAEQARLAALVAEYEIDRQRVAASHDAAADTLEQSLARAGREAALGGEQSRQAIAELRSQLVQVLAEQSRMAARAEEHERERDLMRADHHRALAYLESSKREALADLRSQLQQSSADQGLLAARVEGTERERDLIHAEHHRALADLEAGKRKVTELQWQLSQVSAEQGRLATRIEEHDLARDRLIAEHQQALGDVEASKREALAELRSQLEQSSAEQSRLAARLEEHERAHDRLIAEHHRTLGDVETGKREALTELRSQLSQAFADQRRLAARTDEQELERDRMRAEHSRALADVETRKRDALDELRSELSHTAAEPNRVLAARAEEDGRERDRMSAEHNLAIADLQASNGEALAELRAQLSQAAAEHIRLTALLEEHDRGRERMSAEHRRALADVQDSKREAVAECERVLTEVQQALLVRDGSRLEIERRLIDGINEGGRRKDDGARLASLQLGLSVAFSQMKAVFNDGAALKEPLEAGHDELKRPAIETIEKAAPEAADDERLSEVQVELRRAVSETETVRNDFDPLHDPFDDGDDAFVRQLLEGIPERTLPENLTDPTLGSAQAVSEMQTVTTGDQPAHDVFDAQDSTFVGDLMKGTPDPPRESADHTDAVPLQELPETQPSPPARPDSTPANGPRR